MKKFKLENILIVVLLLYIAYKHYLTYRNIESIKSDVDGQMYSVQDLPDKKEAANTLAQMRKNIITLITHFKQDKFKDDPVVQRLLSRCKPDNIREGAYDPQYTSYTVNKGQEMVFCLRSRSISNFNKLHNINLLTFVCIHELSHICNETVGHDESFHKVFDYLLKEARKLKLYSPEHLDEVEYCGLTVNVF